MTSTQTPWRDRLAARLCNLILTHIATDHYRRMIEGSIRLGMLTAANPRAYQLATGNSTTDKEHQP